jgi:PAS domain S-box-containing protein
MTETPKNPADSFFRSLLQAAPDGILVCDDTGTITQANDQCHKIFGYKGESLIGQKIEVLVPDYIRPKHASLRDGFFANPHRRPMGIGLDLLGKRQNGDTVPVEISLSPVEVDGGSCVIAVVRDVTEARRIDRELKINNEKLRRSNEELEHFAYVASHDLQEPLRMVGGYAQLLQRRYGDKLDADGQEFIAYTVDGVRRMEALINDLLMYSRLSTKGQAFTPVNCMEVLKQVKANLANAIQEARAKIEVESLPFVMGDSVQLIQLFQNLISNSLKFRRPDIPPEVRVSAKREESYWHFQVADNGIGIEPQYAEKIFVIFQRLHSRKEYTGTGIGLAVCKKVVERHSGKIWVESTLGEGATFHFLLPVMEATP